MVAIYAWTDLKSRAKKTQMESLPNVGAKIR
jgi:hypothetical protein